MFVNLQYPVYNIIYPLSFVTHRTVSLTFYSKVSKFFSVVEE